MQRLLAQGHVAANADAPGLWGGDVTITFAQAVARDAVKHADALLAELSKAPL